MKIECKNSWNLFQQENKRRSLKITWFEGVQGIMKIRELRVGKREGRGELRKKKIEVD